MKRSYRTPLLVAGVLIVIWGILGLVDQGNVPYAGYSTDGNFTVVRIYPGSPAEVSGLQIGDYIRSIDGIPMEDSAARARRPRAEIGETRMLVVQDSPAAAPGEGETAAEGRSIAITYSQQPGRDAVFGYVGFIIGLCFIAFGLFAYQKAPGTSAALLALAGLCLGTAILGGPYFESYALRAIVNSIEVVIVICGFAFLLHHLLASPKPKAILGKRYANMVIYGPAVLLALFILFLIVFQPPATGGLNMAVSALFGIFVVLYFGLGMAAMVHSYVKATPRERSDFGLNFMLAGTLIGLLPITISALIAIFAPRLVLPGVDFYFLTLVLIPIALSMATIKIQKSATAGSAT